MELNTNFSGSTKLRDWYPMVKENFETIAEKTSQLEVKANNAMTKRDVNEYFNKVLEATGTSINAVEELAAAITEGGADVIEALQNLSGKRLRNEIYTEQKKISDVISELSEENAILTFKAGATDSPVTPKTTPIVVLHTANTDYLLSPAAVYSKAGTGSWSDIYAAVINDVANCKSILQNQTDVLLGKYTGNGESTRTINLSSYIPNGYEIIAVEVYGDGGYKQYSEGFIWGGLVLKNNPIADALELLANGFIVKNVGFSTNVNSENKNYRFIAYIRRTDATINDIIEIS